MSAYPLTERGFQYADDVLNNRIDACLYVHLACTRFVNDCERAAEGWRYYFDPDESERWLEFLARLPHVKGRWAAKRELFDVAPWQAFIVANLYGWRDVETGLRRFTEGFVLVPRKNGKSFMLAGLGLGHLCIDGEVGAEVYCGATTEAQAWEVFRPARSMAKRSDDVVAEHGIEINAKSLWILAEGSRFNPIIGNPGDGGSPSCAIIDEYHEHKTSSLYDTMTSGMGARDQPMTLVITTAGTDGGGPCKEKHDELIRILDGSVEDETVFGIIYTIDDAAMNEARFDLSGSGKRPKKFKDDAWDTEDALRKANPNFGVSVNRQYLLSELAKARRSPSKQNNYRTKHLCQWVGAGKAWLNMLHVQRCQRVKLKLEKFHGLRAYAGLDLASRKDIASLCVLIEKDGLMHAFCRHYLPEKKVKSPDERINDRYKAWAEAGHLILTPGSIIDFAFIEEDLKQIATDLDLEEIGYDPYQATQFATRMIEEGLAMVEVRPTYLQFSEPMKEVDAWITDKRFRYGDDPVLTWMFGNVVEKIDSKDNVMPDKERPTNKIDGVVALLMAANRWMANKDENMPDDYELTVV